MMDFNAFDVAMAAVVLPPIIAVINQWHFSAQLKGLIALAVCAIYSLIMTIVRGPVDFHQWRDLVLVVAASAFAAYHLWWKPSQIAPAIEAATPLTRRPAPPAPPTV